jgi:hypothetical protein
VLAEIAGTTHDGLLEGEPLGAIIDGRRGVVPPRALQRLDEGQRVVIVGLHETGPDGVGEPVGETPHRLVRRVPIPRDDVCGRHGFAHRDVDGRVTERARLVKGHPQRQQCHARGSAGVSFGGEQHPSRARAERQQRRTRLTRALGKDEHHAARAQHPGGRGEHRVVSTGIVAGLRAPVHGHRAHQAQERTDERMPEEWCLGQHGDGPRHDGHDEHGVHERAVMVRGDEERPRGRNARTPHDVDAAVEDPEEEAHEPADETVGSRTAHARHYIGRARATLYNRAP